MTRAMAAGWRRPLFFGVCDFPERKRGARRVGELHHEMDRTRRERRQSLRFEAEEATTLSAYHTKNFM